MGEHSNGPAPATRWLIAVAAGVCGAAVAFAVMVEAVVSADRPAGALSIQFLQDHRDPTLLAGARLVSTTGSMPFLAVAAVIVGVMLWERRVRIPVAFAPLAALLAGRLVVAVTRHVVADARPATPLRHVADGAGSFPALHAADAAVFLVTTSIIVGAVMTGSWLARTAIGLAAVAAVAVIGAAGMAMATTSPGDVLAGWLIGLLVALPISASALYRGRPIATAPAEPTGALARARADRAPVRAG